MGLIDDASAAWSAESSRREAEAKCKQAETVSQAWQEQGQNGPRRTVGRRAYAACRRTT
jgi:hypothetical protein